MIDQAINFPFSSSMLSPIVGRESILFVHTPTMAELSGSGAGECGDQQKQEKNRDQSLPHPPLLLA
jgi:hypothetical protein